MNDVSKARKRDRTLVDIDAEVNKQLRVLAAKLDMRKQDLLSVIVRKALDEGLYEEALKEARDKQNE